MPVHLFEFEKVVQFLVLVLGGDILELSQLERTHLNLFATTHRHHSSGYPFQTFPAIGSDRLLLFETLLVLLR